MNRKLFVYLKFTLIVFPPFVHASDPTGLVVAIFMLPVIFLSFIFLLLSFILIKKLPIKINYFMIILSLFLWLWLSEYGGSAEDGLVMLLPVVLNFIGIIVYYYRKNKEKAKQRDMHHIKNTDN